MAAASTAGIVVDCRNPIYISTTPTSSVRYNQSARPILMNDPPMAGVNAPAAIRILPIMRLNSTRLCQKM